MKRLSTGTAILICFLIWFGWARYQDYRKAQAEKQAEMMRQQQEKLDGYHRCINLLSRCFDDACRQAQEPARLGCARAYGMEVEPK